MRVRTSVLTTRRFIQMPDRYPLAARMIGASTETGIALRMTQSGQELPIAWRVSVVTLGFFAHRSYLARQGTAKTVPDLAQHALIGFDQETPLRAARKATPEWGREAVSIRTDSVVSELALTRCGCGIGVWQLGLSRTYLKT